MSKPRGWTPTLRYSPVNSMIVDWGVNGQAFSMGCLPARACETPSPVPAQPGCDTGCSEQIVEPVPTYDWHRWVPEVIVGLSNANEDMAASYARRAAIKFATDARVLRRRVAIALQPGVYRYPIDTFEDERVVGISTIDSELGPCRCNGSDGIFIGSAFLDAPRQEIGILPGGSACGAHCGTSGPKRLLVTVWATPTEESCRHDAYLYDSYREDIAQGARGMLMEEAHAYGSYTTYRGDASAKGDTLMFARADRAETKFNIAIRKARLAAEVTEVNNTPPPDLWGGGCCVPRGRR